MAQTTQTKSLSEWDFKTKHVQPDVGFPRQDYVSSESVVLCAAAPPWVREVADENLTLSTVHFIPIGLITGVGLQQNKQVQNMNEVGSRELYTVPGRTFNQMQFSRVLFNGKSLLKATTYYNQEEEPSGSNYKPKTQPGAGYEGGAGSGNGSPMLFINLASDFFSRPTSLGLVFRDSEDESFGAILLDNCYFRNHSMQIAGQQTVISENATVSANNVIPISEGGVTAEGGTTTP